MPLAALLIVAAIERAPLTPTNVWSVATGPAQCILSRTYGDAKTPITFGFRKVPLSHIFEAFIISPSAPALFDFAKVNIEFEPSRGKIETFYKSNMINTRNMMLEFSVNDDFLKGLSNSNQVTFKFVRAPTVRLALSTSVAGLRALGDCEAGLMRQWGLDPAAEAKATQPAKPKSPPASWFRDVVTAELKKTAKSGTSVMLWTIGSDGSTQECRAIVSAGKGLDDAACERIHSLGKYEPARSADGTPIRVHATARIDWVLPKM